MRISVCIATFRRLDRLDAVLSDLRRQSLLPTQVVVVDNDAQGSARPVIESHRAAEAPFRIDFDIQPMRNIAKTRNRTVALADGDWLAFIDDDERAPDTWLQRLSESAELYQADGVLAPVEPQLPDSAPQWIRRGHFYDFPHQPSGTHVPLNRMRFGNVLLRAETLRKLPGPFDERYGLMAGEDGDLLVRAVHGGAKIIWSEEAPVFEPIEPSRLTLRWLLRRAYTGGQEFGRQTVHGRYAPIDFFGQQRFFLRVALQILVAIALTFISWPTGHHRAARWLIRTWANLGKLTALVGLRSQAYQ